MSGSDPVNRLMVAAGAPATLAEKVAADPLALLTGSEELPAAERARRERMRETTAGITSYAADADVAIASFALSGQVGIASLTGAFEARLLDVAGPAIDPRVDPTGTSVAWVADRSLHVADLDGSGARVLAAADSDDISWGLANFLAAEEFDRIRGFWWSPDGQRLIAERVDESDVGQWHIADPASPAAPAVPIRYPAAGTENPSVSLWLLGLDGSTSEITWDRTAFEYVVSVRWTSFGPPLVTVLNREQNRSLILAVDVATGSTSILADVTDPCWVEHVPGTPAWSAGGELIMGSAAGESLSVGADTIDLDGRFIRAVLDVADDGILVATNATPTQCQVEFVEFPTLAAIPVSPGGWTTAVRGGPTLLTISTSLETVETVRTVHPFGSGDRFGLGDGFGHGRPRPRIESFSEIPLSDPVVTLLASGERQLSTAVLFPAGHPLGSARLPVIMNPYGGPHAQRVVESGRAFAEAQWLADQGFCVIVADGRGSPGRSAAFEREIFRDLATAPLQDQVDVLHAVAAEYPDDVDLTRVGITGWSFGGYLAALAVLRRPDVFQAAVAGAPVTEWRLYDTAYTERYLGNPVTDAGPYDATSLLPLAPKLERPLMIIHGMADDNVVVAHSLKLSGELTAAGKPHTFLPLSNVTHMTPQEDVAENLLILQIDFLRKALAAT